MAIGSAVVWEVRPGSGSPNNGGGFKTGATGTDFSQQDTAQVFATDIAIDSVDSSKISRSGATPFNSSHVGNILNITAGTGFSVGRYEIISESSGILTLDRSAGTAGSTGGTGYLGGAVASIEQIFNVVQPGNTVWVRYGTDSLTATRTWTAGTILAPISINGYTSTRGDLTIPSAGGTWANTHSASGFLDVANKFPIIDCGANACIFGSFTIVSGLNFIGSRLVNAIAHCAGSNIVAFRCKFHNSYASSQSRAIQFSSTSTSGSTTIDCDFSNVGASGGVVAAFEAAIPVACRFTSTNGGGMSVTSYSFVAHCLFYNFASGQNAIVTSNADRPLVVANCTFDRCGGNAIATANVAQTVQTLMVMNCHFTNCNIGVNNLRSGTTRIPVIAYNNRFRDTSTTYYGFSNIPDNGSAPGDIMIDQDDATEYWDVASYDFRLKSASSGKGAGLPPFLDTGCWQREETGGGSPIDRPSLYGGIL